MCLLNKRVLYILLLIIFLHNSFSLELTNIVYNNSSDYNITFSLSQEETVKSRLLNAEGSIWNQLAASSPWVGRYRQSAVNIGGSIIIMGGDMSGSFSNYFWLFFLSNFYNVLLVVQTVNGEGVTVATVVVFSDIWKSTNCFKGNSCSWDLITANAPWLRRSWHATVVVADTIILMGGWQKGIKMIF